MNESIGDKINKLNSEQKTEYENRLVDIYEFKDSCVFYGAKDPISLPQEDRNTIKQNLYREMFESKNIKSL